MFLIGTLSQTTEHKSKLSRLLKVLYDIFGILPINPDTDFRPLQLCTMFYHANC